MKKQSSNKQIIVYGTLITRFFDDERYDHLQKETITGFKMLHLGSFPGIVPEKKKVCYGQRFAFNGNDDQWETELARLDRYEGVPHLYVREKFNGAHIYVYNMSTDKFTYAEITRWT